MDNTTKNFFNGCALLFLTPFLLAYHLAAGSFVTKIMWGWFAVPVGLPALSWAQVAGLLLIISLIFNHKHPVAHSLIEKQAMEEGNYWSSVYTKLVLDLIGPWVVLLVGLILHSIFVWKGV